MVRRRNNIDITADILGVAKNGAKKTRIVQRANLNFKILQEYLDELEKAGLIVNHTEGGNIIETTEKGMQYLNCYARLKGMLQGTRVFPELIIPKSNIVFLMKR